MKWIRFLKQRTPWGVRFIKKTFIRDGNEKQSWTMLNWSRWYKPSGKQRNSTRIKYLLQNASRIKIRDLVKDNVGQ